MKPTVYLRTYFIDNQQCGSTLVYRTMRGIQKAFRQALEFYKSRAQYLNVKGEPRPDSYPERDVIYLIQYTDQAGHLHIHKFSRQATED